MAGKFDELLGEGEGREFEDGGLPVQLRTENFSIADFSDNKKFIRWMNKVRRVPLEGIDAYIVAQTYAAAVWEFRRAAIDGNLKATKAIEAWLMWAKPIIQQMAHRDKPANVSKGSVAFLPREPEAEDASSD